MSELPPEVLVLLLGSRFCETDRLGQVAWILFGGVPPGWARVQAICDYVHAHIRFDYLQARSTRSAYDAYEEGVGVCRDYAHVAIAFCGCLNIPARYVNGHLGDIAVPVVDPMDFSAWIEVYLSGGWRTFDPRNNIPRIGRIVLRYGRDAADVPMILSFGPHTMTLLRVDLRGQARPAGRAGAAAARGGAAGGVMGATEFQARSARRPAWPHAAAAARPCRLPPC